ncbi:MAG: glycosyltransferase family 2 protein [Candidatus Yanofskybacteria bacterium]|nr:glycosyltransferase family 2 protein [Candidatus Yanofskybacteria bacterium]
MKISIVTINFNGSEETLKLLKSLKEQTPSASSRQADNDFEIIIVDNASEEADFAHLQTGIDQIIHSFPLTTLQVVNAQLVRNSTNLGFSGGNNVGIRQALHPSTRSGQETGSEWVVLLNNDTWVERDFVERLRAVLEVRNPSASSGQVGIVGIPLIEGSRVAYCGRVQWLKPTLQHEMSDVRCQMSNVYAIGAAMAVRKDVFEKIGFLDEKYFLYFEDADFSIRVEKAGFEISIANPPTGGLNVHHHVSSSTKKLGSPILLRYHYRNALYFNRKNGPWYIKLLIWPWSLIIVIKQLGKLAIRHNIEQSKAILEGVMDFYKNKMGKI